MQLKSIHTHLVQPAESLLAFLDRYLTTLSEKTIVAISSKIISTCENRIVSKASVEDKYNLISKEADLYLEEHHSKYGAHLTIKENRLIPSAGIDESNVLNSYILYPENSQKTAEQIWQHLCEKHGLQQLGIIITDSQITPLRTGVTGIAMAWCGFEPLYNYIGQSDVYHQAFRMTKINLLDAIAASAVLMMGEGNEQMPMVEICHAPKVTFVSRVPSNEEKQSIAISLEEDLFAPLYKNIDWIKSR